MPTEILFICLVAICINRETLSQVIQDFKCSIEFPICQKPGVVRDETDIVKFSLTLDTQDINLDLSLWKTVTVMSYEGDINDTYRRGESAATVHLTECSTSASPSPQFRTPYTSCRRDSQNSSLLYAEAAVWASAKYIMSNMVGVWFNRFLSYRRSGIDRYPMVMLKVVEILMVDDKVMPGRDAYIRPGSHHYIAYCVRQIGLSLVLFKIGGRHTLSSQQGGGRGDNCPGYRINVTRADLYLTLKMRYMEIEGPCQGDRYSTGETLDVADVSSSKSKANELTKQPMELVLILVALSSSAMWMTSTLDYRG